MQDFCWVSTVYHSTTTTVDLFESLDSKLSFGCPLLIFPFKDIQDLLAVQIFSFRHAILPLVVSYETRKLSSGFQLLSFKLVKICKLFNRKLVSFAITFKFSIGCLSLQYCTVDVQAFY